MMKQFSKKIVQLLLLSLTISVMVSCVTADPEAKSLTSKGASQVVYAEGVPGGIVTNVEQLSATVNAIDYTARQVTLVDETGNKKKLQIGPEAVNFNQIQVGDLVKATVADETVVYLRDKGAPANDGVAGLVARTPKGGKPGMLMANTAEVTAVVRSIDIPKHQAILQFADGTTRVVAVRKDVELTPDRIGREVVIRLTEAIAITVESVEK